MTWHLLMKTLTVKDGERALLTRDGRFERVLEPGRHRLFGKCIPSPIAIPKRGFGNSLMAQSIPGWGLRSSTGPGRIIGSSRYYGYEPELGEIEIGWTFLASSHGGGGANREVKRLMLDHAFTFVDTVIFWIGDENWRSQGAMTKIGGIKREGLFTRTLSGDRPYFIFEITKGRYRQGGRALVV